MRVHVVNVMRGTPEIAGHTLDRFASFARGVEERGFHGLWMTDSFGRGRPTLDRRVYCYHPSELRFGEPAMIPELGDTITIERQEFERMAVRLEASGGYRVLRRVTPRSYVHVPDGTPTRRGLFLDVETTGLDRTTDEIIELAMVPFDFSDDGRIFTIHEPFNALRDPGRPIPPAITALTGITDAMVAGNLIDVKEIAAILRPTALVIAHNAPSTAPSAKNSARTSPRCNGPARGARSRGRTKDSTGRGFPIWRPSSV